MIIDTSILCVLLQVDGKETCGTENDQWDKNRVDELLQREIEKSALLVLPLATIIETGNHIAQAKTRRYETAQAFAEIMVAAAEEKSPWAAFTDQSKLWDAQALRQLADEFPNLAMQKISIGDATIKTVADYYARAGFQVEILTGDAGLKAYQPTTPTPIPRRRRSR